MGTGVDGASDGVERSISCTPPGSSDGLVTRKVGRLTKTSLINAWSLVGA